MRITSDPSLAYAQAAAPPAPSSTPTPRAAPAQASPASAPGAAIKFHPLTVTMDAPILAVAAAVTDHNQGHTWLANCCESKVLAAGSPTLVYQRTRVGPLCDDRDVIIAATLDVIDTPAGRALRSWVVEQPSPSLPPPARCIRMQAVRGEILLRPLADGRTEVTYKDVEVRAGGMIPDFITRMAAGMYARQSFRALARRVGMPQYLAAGPALGRRIGW